MTDTIYEGTKSTIDGTQFTFDCDPMDIDTAYDALAENVRLNNQGQDDNQDLVEFENVEDDDVETMLNGLQKMGFIDSWEVED